MTATAETPAFLQWLETATRGLPPQPRAAVQTELTAHYLDTVEAHLAANIPEPESHLLALAELGDPHATADGLRSAHLPVRRLLFATAISVLFTLLVGVLSMLDGMVSDSILYLVLDASLIVTGLVVLSTFQRLPQLHPARLEKPVVALEAGLVLGIGARLAHTLLYGQAMVEPIGYFLSPAAAWPQTVTFLVYLVCELLVGLAMLWLAWRLALAADSLYGLRLPMLVLLAFMGVAGVGLSVALVVNDTLWIEWTSLAGNSGLVIVFVLMALLFFRTSYRPALLTPTRGASS